MGPWVVKDNFILSVLYYINDYNVTQHTFFKFIWNYTFETVAHDVCKYRCIHQNNF